MNKTDIILIVLIVLVTLAVVLAFDAVMQIKSEQTKCISNPATYLIRLLQKENTGRVICSCSLANNPATSLFFDENGAVTKSNSNIYNDSFNYSLVKIG